MYILLRAVLLQNHSRDGPLTSRWENPGIFHGFILPLHPPLIFLFFFKVNAVSRPTPALRATSKDG